MNDMTIGQMTSAAKKFITGPYGYSQGSGKKDGRWSGLTYSPGNFDCSSFSGAVAFEGKMIDKSVLSGTFFTGNFASKMVGSGMFEAIPVKGKSVAWLKANCKEGDFLVGPGHVVYCMGSGVVASFEADERRKKTGGKVGDQTGKEGYFRQIYARPAGWAHIVRPRSVNSFLVVLLAALAQDKTSVRERKLIQQRAPWDGPRLLELLDFASTTLSGMKISLTLDYDVPDPASHVWVVPGSALSSTGKVTAKFSRRLVLASAALAKFPESTVLITGGAPRNGVSEAVAGKQWLESKCTDTSRIIVEDKSSSTIGNAQNSTPLLGKFKTATLITDASHSRRALLDFMAAQAKADTAVNKRLGPAWLTPLVHNDYGQGVIKPTIKAATDTRKTIVLEMAAILGVKDAVLKLIG